MKAPFAASIQVALSRTDGSQSLPLSSRDLLAELRRFNSLSGEGRGGAERADRILPPILRTLQLLLAPGAPSGRAGRLRLLESGGAGLAEEEPGSGTASEVDDLRKVRSAYVEFMINIA